MADIVVAESKIHGLGVFATREFAQDEITLAIDDSRVVDDDHPLRIDLGEQSYHCDYSLAAKWC